MRPTEEAPLLLEHELPQENNPNATARLYLQENGLLYKKYFDFCELTRKNIDNLLRIASDPRAATVPALTLPVEIVREAGEVVGYTMPYHRGVTLREYVACDGVPFAAKLACFLQLADAVVQMPSGIYIGDLHTKNVIVDEAGRIHLIDLDGFSVAGGHTLSCPLASLIRRDVRLCRPKYLDGEQVAVSRETDILCFFDAFLHLLLGGIYFTMYSHACFLDYLSYLVRVGFPKETVADIRALFSDEPNRITLSALARIDPDGAEKYTFRAYAAQVSAQG